MDNNPDNQFVKPNKKPETPGSQPPDDPQNQQPANAPQPGEQFQQPSGQDNQAGNAAFSSVQPPKPKRKWLKTLVAILVIAALAAIGWMLYKEVTKQQSSQAPVTQNKDINQLDVGIATADFGQLYPDIPVVNSYSILTNAQIFEGLVRYEDKSKITPLLATDWTNPDDKTWVFNLKSGVTFHNGNEMQADDVKYSIDKIIASESEFAGTFASTIDSVKAVSDNQVQIKTTAPDPTLLNKLAFLYVIDANAVKDSEPSQAGTGPYEIKTGTKPSKDSVQMVAYSGYHGGSPTTKAVNFSSAKDEDTLLADYQAGKYDIIGPVSESKAESYSGATRFVTNEPEVSYFGFNVTKAGPLKKKQVREAIRYAVDPIKLGEAQGDTVTSLSQLVPKSIPGYNPALSTYEKDVAKAKKLLADAGYPDGVTIELTYSSAGTLPEELAKELKAVGITLKTNQIFSGKAEMYYISYASDILDGVDIYQATVSSSDNYANASLDKILDEASQTVDPAKRLKLLQDAAVIVDNDIPVVPLSTRDNLWLMNQDYDIIQDMPSSLLSVYFYKAQQK
jgi:peptide/nickel transport system substrate-binding protein